MQKPIVAVLSRNSHWINELTQKQTERIQWVAGESWGELGELCRAHHPFAAVLDLPHHGSLPAAENDCLKQLHRDNPEMRLVMRGSAAGNASPGERLAADCPAEDVALLLEQWIDENEAAKSVESENASPKQESQSFQDLGAETVLAGITRRFETNSPDMKSMLQDLEVAARHNVTILLIGETGSGKTYLSKLIHEVSPRRNEPFLHVACGALPNELIESELFGHVKGAFTSAHADKEGKFIAAGSGTILLDEIDVLGPEQQVKLLKVIETGEFEPVGSNRTFVSQARLVVASNLNLQPLVEEGRFRPDLYYRLNMLKFELLPLRARKVDIMPLTKKFIQQLSAKHNIPIARIENSFFEALYAYPWPGNVRELENVIQRSVIYSRDGILGAGQLPRHILAGSAGPANDPSVILQKEAEEDADTLGRQIELTEKEIIEQALFKNSFSRTHTAKDLGISRVTLYNKMKKYGMMKN